MSRFTVLTVPQLAGLLSCDRFGQLTWLNPPVSRCGLKGRIAGTPRSNHVGKRYWHVQIDGRKYLRSHVVFALTRGRWPTLQIDHIDGNSENDSPDNLREATATQNAWNHKGRKKASALPMGVRVAKSGRFVARISVNRHSMTLGTFSTISGADQAYRLARSKYFGEFA